MNETTTDIWDFFAKAQQAKASQNLTDANPERKRLYPLNPCDLCSKITSKRRNQ